MFKMHVRVLDLVFQAWLCFQGFLGKNLCTHNLACVRRLDYAHTSLIMLMQACSCVCRLLPRNPNFLFYLFCFYFHMFVCLASFPMPLCFQCLCFTCLIVCFVSHVRIRVYFGFSLFQCHNHSFTCSCMMPQVLSCCKESKGKSYIQ